jgi:hypothetical protein
VVVVTGGGRDVVGAPGPAAAGCEGTARLSPISPTTRAATTTSTART